MKKGLLFLFAFAPSGGKYCVIASWVYSGDDVAFIGSFIHAGSYFNSGEDEL